MKEKEPFPEILSYLNFLKSNFEIEVAEYENSSVINQNFMKEAIQDFTIKHEIKAIIAGTRSTDPYAQNLTLSQWSDSHLGWPSFQRILPIYFWDYSLVWRFIKEANIPYCELYDSGYTYVGDQINSIPNPFIEGLHAEKANDNIELFSRTQLFKKLPRKFGKILFTEKDIILIGIATPNDISRHEIPIKSVQRKLFNFCEQRGFAFEGNIGDLNIETVKNTQLSSEEIFIQSVLKLKRNPGNFLELYLGIVVDFINKQISIHI